MQFFLPIQKNYDTKTYKKGKRWIVTGILYIFFNVNQINQLCLCKNEAPHHHICGNDTHR